MIVARQQVPMKAKRSRPTLDQAIDEVLLANGNRPMTTSAIAGEIGRRGSFLRPRDGRPPPPSQISARIANATYRDRYERTPLGIRLRTNRDP